MGSHHFFMGEFLQVDFVIVDLPFLFDDERFHAMTEGDLFRDHREEAIGQKVFQVVTMKATVLLNIKGTQLRYRRSADSTGAAKRGARQPPRVLLTMVPLPKADEDARAMPMKSGPMPPSPKGPSVGRWPAVGQEVRARELSAATVQCVGATRLLRRWRDD